MSDLRKNIELYLEDRILLYCQENMIPPLWETPIIKYADAHDPRFSDLKEIVTPKHLLPQDILPNAKTVLSYFLPFQKMVALSNLEPGACSELWASAYNITNLMAAKLNDDLADFISLQGYEAAVPQNIGMMGSDSPEHIRSRWSQRHVAFLAGHGTFGINNMLISDCGCVGRYYSIVTTLPFSADPSPVQERCLYKRNGSCGLCVKHCDAGALTAEGFNRTICMETCAKNEAQFGADVCGKCMVGLPCSFAVPK